MVNLEMDESQLRFILGAKLKQLRNEKDLSLSDIATMSGVSVSYLSEIEKGKKYPAPATIIRLSRSIGVSFDELVSARMSGSLDPLTTILQSSFIREFPFELFGIKPYELMNLVTNKPQEAGAFIQTLLEIGQSYDMSVEQFLFAALRSYQKMHNNYFDELECAAEELVRKRHWKAEPPRKAEDFEDVLVRDYGYDIGEIPLSKYPELAKFRSICSPGKKRKLFLNGKLLPSQKAFLLAREIGFRVLALEKHPVTSTWLEVESFEEVLNNFKASYFAGALFISRRMLVRDLETFFKLKKWDGDSFLGIMGRYDATPEMFLYRLSQLIPKYFGLQEMFYLRFNNAADSRDFVLTKELNMSRVVVPHAMGLNEHYCRRWLSIQLLQKMGAMRGKRLKGHPLVDAHRSYFVDNKAEFFVIAVGRALALTGGTNSSISLGFLVDDNLKEKVRFWNDDSVSRVEVNETCERCSLPKSSCRDRVAPPSIARKDDDRERREKALQQFLTAVS